MRLPDFEAWAIFACVVEHRSFSATADAIGVSKATVSKAVARLEQDLGISLFHRTSRRLTLTENGRELAEHARRILAEGQAADETARDGASVPTGLVRIAAPMSFGTTFLAPLLAEFLAAYPDIEAELHLSDARVDIVAEGYDIALRIADLPDSSLRSRRLCGIPVLTVVAPAYLAARGRPAHPADLANHACLGYTNIPGRSWRFVRDGEEATVRHGGPLSTNSGEAMLPAVRAGLGIARLPEFIVADDLARGTIETILDDWAPPPIGLHLLTPPSALRPARVEVLIDFLVERFRTNRVRTQ